MEVKLIQKKLFIIKKLINLVNGNESLSPLGVSMHDSNAAAAAALTLSNAAALLRSGVSANDASCMLVNAGNGEISPSTLSTNCALNMDNGNLILSQTSHQNNENRIRYGDDSGGGTNLTESEMVKKKFF